MEIPAGFPGKKPAPPGSAACAADRNGCTWSCPGFGEQCRGSELGGTRQSSFTSVNVVQYCDSNHKFIDGTCGINSI